jgi:fructan beta-fructosidase
MKSFKFPAMRSFIFFFFSFCSIINGAAQKKPDYKERYRPRFHFTPATNWTNDPNGLIYYNHQYHLFYQHNPYGNRWGHMSWGHAVSPDLVHWKHLPLAIPEFGRTMIFSGSAVFDQDNSSGFGQQGHLPLVAVYTALYVPDSTKPDQSLQFQNIAYSLNEGLTWTQYAGNPVLDLNRKDFRDPFTFWFEPQKKWIMATVWPKEHLVKFYESPNLKNWKPSGEFGPAGDTSEIWECPALTQIPIEGSPSQKKWVLFNSQQTTMQYFVGDFDGNHFISEMDPGDIRRPDYGSDFYAGVTYNNLPSGQQPVLLGWANNWSYANDIPTDPWKSMMGMPRLLSLKRTSKGWRLLQKPPKAITALRGNHWDAQTIQVENRKLLPIHTLQGEIHLQWVPSANSKSGILLALGQKQYLQIGYDAANQKVYINREFAGDTSFNTSFARLSKYEGPIELQNGKLNMTIFIDHSIVEVFANDGELVMTTQIFPDPSNDGMALFSEGTKNIFSKIEFWQLKSAW